MCLLSLKKNTFILASAVNSNYIISLYAHTIKNGFNVAIWQIKLRSEFKINNYADLVHGKKLLRLASANGAQKKKKTERGLFKLIGL